MTIKTMIVDDEPLARERIRSLLQGEKEVAVIAECANGKEALAVLKEHPVDLIFLDIQMPEMDGVRMLENIPPEQLPFVIFTTAFDSFAVKAFELNALDYLLKPFTKKRFLDSLSRVRQRLSSDDKDLYLSQMLDTIRSVAEKQEYSDKLIVKTDGRVRFIPASEILWIESDANYLKLHTQKEAIMIRETLTNLSKKIDPAKFLRLHRTVIVNTEHIKELKPWFNDEYVAILRNGTQLPIGRTYKKSVNEFFKL